MLISHKHKFILLHAGKCAGSSIRNCLDSIIDETKVKISKGHPNLSECQEIIKKSNHNPKEYMVIGMVRNPFDRMVSWYYHALYKSKAFNGKWGHHTSFHDKDIPVIVNVKESISRLKKSDLVIFQHVKEGYPFG